MRRLYTFVILVILSPVITLYAANIPDILNDINTTFSKSSFKQLSDINEVGSLTIDDIENNVTLKQAVLDYEQLLPRYLQESTLFKKSFFEGYITIYHYRKFMYASLLHLKMLDKNDEVHLMNMVLNKNFHNLDAFIESTNSLLDYAFAITTYQVIFELLEKSDNRTEVCQSLLKNAPPSTEHFYNMYAIEKRKSFILAELTLLNSDELKSNSANFAKLMKGVVKQYKHYYNQYMNRYLNASRSGSSRAIKKYRTYITEERRSLTSFSHKLKFTYESLKLKSLAFFGLDVNIDNLADYMGKIIALVGVPKFTFELADHEKMIKKYKELIISCKKL